MSREDAQKSAPSGQQAGSCSVDALTGPVSHANAAGVSGNRAGPPARARGVERALKRSGPLLALRTTQYGLAFLASVIVTRVLGPSGRAEYALPLAFTGTVLVAVHLSIELSAQRLLGRREATLKEMAGFLSAATIVMSAVAVPLAIAIGMAVRDRLLSGATPESVVLASLTIPFSLAGQMAAALLFRIGALRAYGVIAAASGALQLALVISFSVVSHIKPETALLITLIVVAATAVTLCVALARHTGHGALLPRTSRRLARAALAAGLSLHASSIALFLNLQIDLLLVSALTDSHQSGIYSLSATLATLLFVATTTIGLSALQTQTDADESEAAEYTVDFTRQTFGLSIVFAAVAAAGAYPFILVAYGSKWLPSVAPFAALTVASVGIGVEGPARNLLIRIGRPATISKAAIAALAVNVALNLALIPSIGIMGAAIASVASYWCAALLMVWLVQRETGIPMRHVLAWPRHGDPLNRLVSPAGTMLIDRGRKARRRAKRER